MFAVQFATCNVKFGIDATATSNIQTKRDPIGIALIRCSKSSGWRGGIIYVPMMRFITACAIIVTVDG